MATCSFNGMLKSFKGLRQGIWQSTVHASVMLKLLGACVSTAGKICTILFMMFSISTSRNADVRGRLVHELQKSCGDSFAEETIKSKTH